jgi:hypothetical protein
MGGVATEVYASESEQVAQDRPFPSLESNSQPRSHLQSVNEKRLVK